MADPAFQIGPGTWVRLRYSAFDEDGESVEDEPQEIGYVHGYGALLPRIEAALEGKRANDTCRIVLPSEEAFGPRRDDAVLECDPEEFDGVRAGDRLEAETSDGGIVVLRVLEVRPDAVVVDTNHPLAGQRATFELQVLEVRPATAQELSEAEARATMAETGPEAALIPLQRLLRGPSRRYERERSPTPEPGAGRLGEGES